MLVDLVIIVAAVAASGAVGYKIRDQMAWDKDHRDLTPINLVVKPRDASGEIKLEFYHGPEGLLYITLDRDHANHWIEAIEQAIGPDTPTPENLPTIH